MKEDRIAEALEEWFAEPGNTQAKAAKEIGIEESVLHDRLRGRSLWKWGEARKVAHLTGKEVSDFE